MCSDDTSLKAYQNHSSDTYQALAPALSYRLPSHSCRSAEAFPCQVRSSTAGAVRGAGLDPVLKVGEIFSVIGDPSKPKAALPY